MNKKKERKKLIIIFVACACIFLVSCAVLAYGISNLKGSSEIPVYTAYSSETACGFPIPRTESEMKSVSVNNIDSRAAIAEKMRVNTDSSLPSMKKGAVSDKNITVYRYKGRMVRADVKSGAGGFQCSRSYYFNNGILYMADISYSSDHDTLYFSEDTMYRLIDRSGDTKDLKFSDYEYMAIGSFAYSEAQCLNK